MDKGVDFGQTLIVNQSVMYSFTHRIQHLREKIAGSSVIHVFYPIEGLTVVVVETAAAAELVLGAIQKSRHSA
jgi:hypothetical protein